MVRELVQEERVRSPGESLQDHRSELQYCMPGPISPHRRLSFEVPPWIFKSSFQRMTPNRSAGVEARLVAPNRSGRESSSLGHPIFSSRLRRKLHRHRALRLSPLAPTPPRGWHREKGSCQPERAQRRPSRSDRSGTGEETLVSFQASDIIEQATGKPRREAMLLLTIDPMPTASFC